MAFQAVIFSLGTEEFGLPIEAVQEITHLAEIHPVPKAPKYIKGLINIRGEAIPLIDMHERFGIETHNNAEYAIIVEINNSSVGMAVDEVKEVRTLDNISPPPPLVTAPFIGGIVNMKDRMIIQIYPEYLLESEELCDIKQLVG